MLTNYVFMIPIRTNSTEEVIKAYLTGVYSTFGGNRYFLKDVGSEFTSKQFTWIANKLGFIKVFTSHYTPTGNSIIENTHAFLKASLRMLICIHQIEWDEIVHISTMANNVFLHSSAGEAPFYLMFGCDALCQLYLNYYCQSSDTWVMKNVESIWML